MRTAILAACTFSAAGCLGSRNPDCTTDYGSIVYSQTGTADCKGLSIMQARVAEQYQSLGWSKADIEASFAKLHIEIQPTESWYNIAGVKVGGETTEEASLIAIGTADKIQDTAIAHESVHFLEWTLSHHRGIGFGCTDEEIAFRGADHCSWKRRGVWEAIRAVNEVAQ